MATSEIYAMSCGGEFICILRWTSIHVFFFCVCFLLSVRGFRHDDRTLDFIATFRGWWERTKHPFWMQSNQWKTMNCYTVPFEQREKIKAGREEGEEEIPHMPNNNERSSRRYKRRLREACRQTCFTFFHFMWNIGSVLSASYLLWWSVFLQHIGHCKCLQTVGSQDGDGATRSGSACHTFAKFQRERHFVTLIFEAWGLFFELKWTHGDLFLSWTQSNIEHIGSKFSNNKKIWPKDENQLKAEHTKMK